MKGIGDYPLAIFLSLNGKVHYINKVMSCYRVGSVNSWVQRQLKNTDKVVSVNKSIIAYLNRINEMTRFEYNDSIEKASNDYLYMNAILEKNRDEIRRDPVLLKRYKNESFSFRFKFLLKSLLK